MHLCKKKNYLTMMKKSIFLLLLLSAICCAQAQVNVQLHRDFGRTLYSDQEHERPQVTTTVEVLKPDRWGTTYFFVDMDYLSDGVSGVFMKFTRDFTLARLSANSALVTHWEYNGGMQSIKSNFYGNRFQHSLVGGLGWTWHSNDFSKTYLVNLGYRQHFKDHTHEGFAGFHANQVWKIDFGHRRFTFNGFSEVWYNKTPMGKISFLTEPQFWVNLNTLKGMEGANLSLGTEVEMSNNFIYANWLYNPLLKHQTFYMNPTLAMKWTF